MSRMGFVYIMTNKNKTTLYIGVTNDLCRRIYEHKNHLNKNSFTDKYNLEYCIYYEEFPYFSLAINREKELKKWNRQKKEDLINKKNPEWKVLVTEKGFVRDSPLSPGMTNEPFNKGERGGEIPPAGRNDEQHGGGEIPHAGRNDERHGSGGIPHSGRNDERHGGGEIPHFFRNDAVAGYNIGVIGGGEAATNYSPSPTNDDSHSERSEETNEIPLAGRNDEQHGSGGIPHFVRNDAVSGYNIGVIGGGEAATNYSPSPTNDDSHSERSEETKNKTNNEQDRKTD